MKPLLRMRKPRRLFGQKFLLISISLLAYLAAIENSRAQTPAEAAAINVQYALSVCFDNYRTPLNIHTTFSQAGLAYTQENNGNGNIIHWYAAPGDTMNVAVISDDHSAKCRIVTTHYGVEQMLPFARAVVRQLFRGNIYDGAPEGQNILPGTPQAQRELCSGFHLFAPRKLIWIKLARAGNDGTCISDGTAQIIIN